MEPHTHTFLTAVAKVVADAVAVVVVFIAVVVVVFVAVVVVVVVVVVVTFNPKFLSSLFSSRFHHSVLSRVCSVCWIFCMYMSFRR